MIVHELESAKIQINDKTFDNGVFIENIKENVINMISKLKRLV